MFAINTILIPIVFTCILPHAISNPYPLDNESSAPDRAEVASISVGELLRRYNLEQLNMSNSTGSSSSHTGKKAAQDTYNNTQGVRDIRDLLPYLVDNIISPLLKRVFLNGNAYTYFRGSSASTAAPAAATTAAAAATAPPTRKRRTRTTTTTTENVGRDLLEENGKGEVGSTSTTAAPTTTSKGKYTVNRVKDRASTSTQKPYEDNSDDEDETLVFNKIKHL